MAELEEQLADSGTRPAASVPLAGEGDLRRLVAILESTSDLVSTATPDGRIAYLNSAGRALLGWTEEEVPEHRIPDLHTPEAGRRILEEYLPIALSDGVWRGETSLRKPDGTDLPVSQVILVHRDDAGEVEYLSTIMRDLSDVRSALAEVRESKEMLEVVMDSVPQHIFWKDFHSVYLGCNSLFAKVAGLARREEIAGKTDFDLPWTRAESEFFRECDRRVMDHDAPEYHIIEPQTQVEGRAAWLDTTKVPLHDDTGVVVGMLGAFEDVTEKIEAERALAASEENLRITLDSIGDAVIATDARGNVTRMNPVAELLTGWSEAEALSRPLAEVFRIVHGDSREVVRSPVERVLEKGEVVGLEQHTLLLAADGAERQVADSGAPIRNGEGEIVGVVLVFRDVTEQYRLEEQLRQVQKMDSVGQLAGGVAHDFNNMLTGIMGAAELLAPRLEPNPELRRLVDSILEAAESAAGLTQRLLDFSRKGRITSRPVELHRVVQEVVELLGRSVDRRIRITLELEAESQVVVGDPSQLQNAVLNLGVNARDAMPEGGELCFATRDILDEGGRAWVELCVTDTGEGIAAEHLERIFEPFFTTKEVGRGTGLGLAAVFGTVQGHQGSIDVESRLEVGTTFRIRLPTVELQVPAEGGAERTPERGTGRVLVVDDEPLVRHMIENYLTTLGYEVLLADDGATGVERYREECESIDLVVLDTVMPRMSGRDAYRELVAIRSDVRVLFMSGFLREATLEPPDERVVGFLKKPFRVSELAALVERGVRGARGGAED